MIWYDMIWYDMIWYDMIWYDMIWYYLLELGFHPVKVVGKLVQIRKETAIYKRKNNTQSNAQKTQDTQNRKQA